MQASKDRLLSFFKLNQTVVSAKGGSLWLENGEVVYDFLSQYGANPLGANDDGLIDAATRFLSAGEPTLCQPLVGSHVVKLKERLLHLCDYEQGDVLLCQSGTEAVELAIKVARAATRNTYTIALENGFHGKTTGSVQLTANSEYREYFGVSNEFVRHLSTDIGRDLEADFAALTADGKVNGIVLEFVQGEGGMRALDKNWVSRVVALAREKGILVIADEVQTGLGRTGSLFAYEQYDVKPDMVLLAKALGGGLVPIGACITAPDICPPEFTLFHSSTFANNNFTCSVSNAVLDRLEKDLVDSAKCMGEYLVKKLYALVACYPDIYSNVSGKGLMLGLHLRPQKDNSSYVSNFYWNCGLTAYAAAGWLLRTQQILLMPCFSFPACLRIQPPLNSTEDHIDKVIFGLEKLARLLRSDIGVASLMDPDLDTRCDLGAMGLAKPFSTAAVSSRHRSYAVRSTNLRRFQFAMHPLHAQSCLNSLPDAVDGLDARQRQRYGRRIMDLSELSVGFSDEGYLIKPFRLGEREIEGRLYILNMTAEQIMAANCRQRKMALRELANAAHQYNPDVYGLGAFTSIIAQGGFLLRDLEHQVTTGSSLTAFAAVQAALNTPEVLKPVRFGVIGANGSVGALCWQLLFLEAAKNSAINRVSLFYNPNNPRAIKELANTIKRAIANWGQPSAQPVDVASILPDIARLYASGLDLTGRCKSRSIIRAFCDAVSETLGRDFLHIAPTDDTSELQQLDRVLVATNRVGGVNELYSTRPGTILYDIGYPLSFDPKAMALGGRDVYSAGLVRCPGEWEFGKSNIAELPAGIALGCFAETMTLAATDLQATPKSVGIKLTEAARIGNLALSVGLTPTTILAAQGSVQRIDTAQSMAI